MVLGLASAALARGINTLVVDMDPQGDATMGLDIPPGSSSVAQAILDPRLATIADIMEFSPWCFDTETRLGVLPGAIATAELDSPHLNRAEAQRLSTALAAIHGFDLVLIDCPPSLNGLTTMALTASHRALIVTEPTLFAVAAADRALRAIDGLRRSYAPQLQPLGIVVNRVRTRSTEHKFRFDELIKLFGPLVLAPAFPDRTALQQAQGTAQPIHEWTSAGAEELSQNFDALLARVIRASKRGRRRSA